MKLRLELRNLAVETVKLCGPRLWPYMSGLPKLGKYAKAQILARLADRSEPSPPGKVELLPGLSSGEPSALEQAAGLLASFGRAGRDISREVRLLKSPSAGYAGAKAALLAHWDPDGVVDPYVWHYARALRELGYRVALVTDRDPAGFEGLGEIFDAVVVRDCPGYDFTSWKAGLCALPSLHEAEELLITNDSVFAPVGDLMPVHETMQNVACDFWGLVESRDKRPHLQSYYLVFKRPALASQAFQGFFERIGAQTDKEQVIAFELSLALWLASHGLQAAAFSPAANQPSPELNPTHCGFDYLVERCKVPLLKRDLLFGNPYKIPLERVPGLLADKGYPIELIINYAKRRGLTPLFPLNA